MSIRAVWLATGMLLFACASACAQVKDAVELLPPQTLACIELRNPEGLSREVAALVKGSALDDLPRRLSKMGGIRSGDYRFHQQRELLTFASIFLCPEAINEAGKIRGGFIALTGFAKDNTPEWIGVLQTGTSNFPGIIMRAFVTETSPKMVGEVEGVSLYREKRLVYAPIPAAPGGQPGMPRQPEERESGPVVGQMPGLILFGSSVDSLKAVIQRAKSKRGGASLTSLQAFKESAALRARPGLFAYVDMAALEAKLDELSGGAEGRPGASPTTLKTLLGNQTLRSLTFSLTLQSGMLQGQMRFQLDGKNDSPLFGLLPDRAAQGDLLHFAPKDAFLALVGGLGDNEKRWKTVLNVLDASYKLRGSAGDNRPSRAIEEMEKKLDFRIHKDVLAEVTGAGIALYKNPAKDMLLLRASDEKAAAKLEKDGLPRLYSLGNSEVLMPIEEEVQGRRIKTVKGGWNSVSVHYGRQGAVLVIGLDKERVAESLIAGGKKQGLLAETKVSAAIKEIGDKVPAIGVLPSARAAMDLLAVLSRPSIQSRPMMKKMPAPPAGGGAPGGPGAPPPQPPKAEELPDKTIELSKPMQALLKESEPLVFCLNRQAESLVLEIRPLPLRRMSPRLLDAWVEALLKPSTDGTPAPGMPVPILPPAKIKR